MYYEEKVIEGVLHWRGSPDGEWTPISAEQLTTYLVKERSTCASLTATLDELAEEWVNGVGGQAQNGYNDFVEQASAIAPPGSSFQGNPNKMDRILSKRIEWEDDGKDVADLIPCESCASLRVEVDQLILDNTEVSPPLHFTVPADGKLSASIYLHSHKGEDVTVRFVKGRRPAKAETKGSDDA